jgi:quinol monooxygenase YgiN
MNKIQLTARMKIHPGKLEEFKKLAKECMVAVKAKDKGALQYDWFFSEDQTECVIRETYVDSAAALNHATIVGELLAEMFKISDFSGELFGNMSDELRATLGGMGVKMYKPFQSM